MSLTAETDEVTMTRLRFELLRAAAVITLVVPWRAGLNRSASMSLAARKGTCMIVVITFHWGGDRFDYVGPLGPEADQLLLVMLCFVTLGLVLCNQTDTHASTHLHGVGKERMGLLKSAYPKQTAADYSVAPYKIQAVMRISCNNPTCGAPPKHVL